MLGGGARDGARGASSLCSGLCDSDEAEREKKKRGRRRKEGKKKEKRVGSG